MTDLTYQDIEHQIVERLPELREAAEYYWEVEGTQGNDCGPYIFFQSMFGCYVEILLAIPSSSARDEMLVRAFGLVEVMLDSSEAEIPNLAYVGLLEWQGGWWWGRAQPFMGPSAKRELDTYDPSWREKIGGSRPNGDEFIDLYGVRAIIARELSQEGISIADVPGATYKTSSKKGNSASYDIRSAAYDFLSGIAILILIGIIVLSFIERY